MLYFVATPIGNLGDISKRAIEVLEQSDLVLCEDTRYTKNLLFHLKIRKPLISMHRFNERSRQDKIIKELKEGRTIAVVSDAGTPCINDPGHLLVQRCVEEKIPFSATPGPCSYIQALVLSGFYTDRFQCVGFLPRKKGEKANFLSSLLDFPGTTIAFESPHRLVDTLRILTRVATTRQIALARELTKTFEECLRGSPQELLDQFSENKPKGEFVLLINHYKPKRIKNQQKSELEPK